MVDPTYLLRCRREIEAKQQKARNAARETDALTKAPPATGGLDNHTKATMSSSHATSAEAATGDSGYAPPPAEIPQGTANGQAAAAAGSATVTITEEQAQSEEEVLMLHLRPRPSVRWYVEFYMDWIYFKV
jgi:hypothetical protein